MHVQSGNRCLAGLSALEELVLCQLHRQFDTDEDTYLPLPSHEMLSCLTKLTCLKFQVCIRQAFWQNRACFCVARPACRLCER
jgi:hypothetical protein